ncbi:MAG: acetyl-CoA carboxylase biotin carboxyl carrier protein [Alphaproteobacteria bacterium]|nr:acetyl-CoA carboxylase biotin carboxyl carrier protein [Alphaproteobacteria bacterium]
MSKQGDLNIDGELVRTLAALLSETGLSEIEYAVGDRRIRVARGGNTASVVIPALPAAATTGPAADGGAAALPPPTDHPGALKAPMVGTVYLAPQPEAAPFAKLGDMIAEGQVLLIIEAMKVMNQIRAAKAGRLVRVLVEDGAPVEFGQALMILE